MTDDQQRVLDRAWDLHVAHDAFTPLWNSDIDQIERWPRFSSDATDEVVAELEAARDEAERAAQAGGPLAPSLRTVADALELLAATLGVNAELSAPHPSQGLHAFLFWAVPDFALQTAEHGERYVTKLERFPEAIEDLAARLEDAAGAGRAPVARHTRGMIAALDDHLAMPLDEDPLTTQPPPTELGHEAVSVWRDEVAAAVEHAVRPGIRRLRDALVEHSLPAGRDDEAVGMCHLPGGEATYLRLLRAYTVPTATPQAVHDTGLAQVARLAQEYRELGATLFDTDDVATILTRLRDDSSLYHDTSEGVVAAAEEMHARAVAEAPAWFHRTPASPCVLRPTEHGSVAFYSPPTPDGSRPGTTYFNTADPSFWGPQLAATMFHEGIPGHHYQGALGIEATDLHDMHRNLFLPAFGEGWALYAERLADAMGLYDGPVERIGMLVSDSLRACRLVVDTGMHALGWTRQQAIDFMAQNSPLHVGEIEAEVDRYIGYPGQACAYMIGRLEIEALRDEADERLGDAFDLRTFHDVVLSHGMVSLPALRQVVEAWDGSEPAADT